MRLNAWLATHKKSALWNFSIAAGTLATLAGLGIASEGAFQMRRGWTRDQWPVANGVVIRVEDRTDRVANGKPADSRVATYAFLLDGHAVVGEQSLAIPRYDWTFGSRTNDLRAMHSGPCQVHYNPENPGESWIRPEESLWEAILLGLLFAGLGFGVAYGGWRMKREAAQLIGEQRGLDSLPKEPGGAKRWEVGVFGV
jgi:hypothetical protein